MHARFWIRWNSGEVKLTLRPGDVIILWKSYETDEGYAFRHERFEHDGDSIIRESVYGGSDCDGPIKHHSTYKVPLWKMRPHPEWKRISSYQRDHYAEAAGY